MSTTNLIIITINLFFSSQLPLKQPIKVDQHNISRPKTGIQDLVVTHYDCSPKHITKMQYYKIKKIGECKIKTAYFTILTAQVHMFSQIRTLLVCAFAIHAKLSDKESFCHKISLKRGFWFDHNNWYVNNMERTFLPTEIEARREFSGVGLINKNHYRPQMIQFHVLDDPRWQANIEEKQGRFRLDRYKLFSLQHWSMVYNPRYHNWIPNATDNPLVNCPGNDSEHEYLVIHTLGWSLQLTNITLIFDVASEHMYYGKVRIKCDIEWGYCPLNHAIKAIVIWEPVTHCRLFDVGRSHARVIKFQKIYFFETLENNETNSGHKRNAHMYSRRFQKHLYCESALSRFEVLTKPIIKCNEDRPYYATQYQDTHYSPWRNTLLTPYTKANIRDIHRNHNYTADLKNMNCLENKIGLALFTLRSKSMQNLIIWSVESCSK